MDNHMDELQTKRRSDEETISQALQDWVLAASLKDGPALTALLSDDVALFPPFLEDPLIGRAKTLDTLSTFSKVTKNFSYGRAWYSANVAVLEFKAEIEGQSLHGLDLIEFNDLGKIERFEVMARPYSAVTLLKTAILGGS